MFSGEAMRGGLLHWVVSVVAMALVLVGGPSRAETQVTAFMQSVAEASSGHPAIAEFYRSNGYQPIWTDDESDDRGRVAALLKVLAAAEDHGLPVAAYDLDKLETALRTVRSGRDLGRIEVELSRTLLRYAADLQTGILTPASVDPGLVMEVPLRDPAQTLTSFAKSRPGAFLKSLVPSSPEYTRLMKAKFALEKRIGAGGWGPSIPSQKLEPGESGASVVALRNRLIAMGYLARSARQTYDGDMQSAVQRFQTAHGLTPDGVAGPATIAEINIPAEDRLASVLVAMERERWINKPLGARHVWVNLADFTARIVDDGKVTFETRSVIGAKESDRRSPEFSDVMEHMVVNPTWNVPRSIAVKEYLPMLQRNPFAVGHLRVINSRGQVIDRNRVDFTRYNARNFPFDIKQPPSDDNALGLVKFMFPNKYNIYLHDTPSKSLFGREVRAFSHGCIRLADPFDFAYTLLAPQTDRPQELFRSKLATGVETVVPLEQPIPVHLVYRTAFTNAKGELNFRRDVYGRDARIFSELQRAGVVLRGVQS